MIVVGAGQISMAIARKMGAGKKIILGDKNIENAKSDYSHVIAPVVADLCTTPVALSAPPNSYQNNSQS